MQDAKAVMTPMEVNNRLKKTSEEYTASPNIIHEYKSLIGGLMWPAIQTRANIAYANTQLAKHMNNPTLEHLDTARRVLCYLKGKPNYEIIMTGTGDETLHVNGFTDASLADDIDTARSTEYLFICVGGLISCKSGQQKTVS